MKIKSLLIGVLALGLFASCSNETETVLNNEGTKNIFDENGKAFVKINLQLPSSSGNAAFAGTRAIGGLGDGYGEFNDGISNEYAVENATLVVFSSTNEDGTAITNESGYRVVGAYQISDAAWNTDPEIQVTTNRTFVKQISNGSGASDGSDLWAYVILNRHQFFYFSDEEATKGHLFFRSGKGDADVDLDGKTMATFSELALKESGRRYDANSFLMTNMPYANQGGGASTPTDALEIHTLYPLEGAIYKTLADAQAPTAKAAEINVERVLAKVETSLAATYSNTTSNKGYKFQFLGWFIDNTNPNAYIGRHYNINNSIAYNAYSTENNLGTPVRRFISETPISATQPNRYRTFWAYDMNYDSNAFGRADGENLVTEGGAVVDNNIMKYEGDVNVTGGRLRAFGSHYYCTENTFDVKHQSVSNTTRVIVAAQFLDASDQPKDFYTIATEADVMYTENEIKTYAKNLIAKRIGIETWAHDWLTAGGDAASLITIDIVKPTNGTNPISGRCTLKVAPLANSTVIANLQTGKNNADAIVAFNNLINSATAGGKVGHNEYLIENCITDFYNKGVSYYAALIKHFGDYETPWDYDAHAGMPNTTEKIYDSWNETKYLGRYGVVRNNWYKIEVDGIKQIGSAVVPKVPGKDPLNPNDPDTPDDNVENFLKVKINIMPWVIRKQSVTL